MRFKLILFIVFSLVFSVVNAKKGFTIKTVVIDAGHGGKDPGATGPGKVNEKDVALAVALKLGEFIQKNFPSVNVIYTRKKDTFLELHERADIANQNKADLFIAIHCNSSPNNEAYGTSTYVLGLHRTEANLEVAKRENSVILLEDDRDKNYEFDPNTAEGHIIMSMKQNAFLDQSIDVASKVENQYENFASRKSLGVKQAGFYVLYKTTMPSLLSEIGFISNPDEEKFLSSTKGQEQIAESIFKAFKEYKAEVESSKTTESSSTDASPQGTVTTTTSVTTTTKTTTASVTPTTKIETPPVLIADTQTVKLRNGKVIKKPVENSSGGGNVMVAKPVETPVIVKQVAKDTVLNPPHAADQIVKKDTVYIAPPTAVTKPPVQEEPKPSAPVTQVTKTVSETATTTTMLDTTAAVPPVKKEQPPVAVKEIPKESVLPPVTTKVEDKPKQAEVAEVKPAKTEPKPVISHTEPEVKTVKPAPVAVTKPAAPKAETKPVTKVETKTESGITYKVQLFALKGALKDADQAKINKLFKEHSDEKIPNLGLTRYYVGNTTSLGEAKRILAEAIGDGYSGAFIVGIKDGRRIGMEEIKALEGK